MPFDKKRLVLAMVTCIAVVIVIWQIYAMMHSGYSSTSSTAKPVRAVGLQPVTRENARVSAPLASSSGKTPKYVQLAKQIELAKMKRKLAEQQVAIAHAKQRLASMQGTSAAMSLNPVSQEDNAERYQLLGLSNQPHRGWEVMLRVDGKLVTAHAHQRLPNGDEVVSISPEQVLINQHPKILALSFDGSKYASSGS